MRSSAFASMMAPSKPILPCFALLLSCCELVLLVTAAATTTTINFKNSQIISKPKCCWQCVAVPGCVDALDQSRALDMLSELKWAAGRRKDTCAKRKCPEAVVSKFANTGPRKQTIPAYVSLVLANTRRRVALSGPRTTTYAPHSSLTLRAAALSASAYATAFSPATTFALTAASSFTLSRGSIAGPLYLLSLHASAATFHDSTLSLTSTHVSLAARATLTLQRSTLTLSERAPRLALPGPYSLGTAAPFVALDSTIVVRAGTLAFINISDVFLIRSTLLLAANSKLALTHSNLRLISSTLTTARATITLTSSRLLLSGTKAATDRLVAKVTGSMSVPRPVAKGPLRDISGQQFLASGTGTIVLTSG